MDGYEDKLSLFGIPGGSSDGAAAARKILARLLAIGSVRLYDMQVARDIAGSLGIVDDPVAYLFIAAMSMSFKAGNVYIEESCVARLLKEGGYDEEEDDDGRRRFESDVDRALETLDAFAERFHGMLRSLRNPLVVRSGTKWFFKSCLDAVSAIGIRIRGMSGDDIDGVELAAAELAVFGRYEWGSLNGEQLDAVGKVLTRRLVVVTGGPGTGKTTTLCSILRAIFAKTDMDAGDVALVAPTGRAAQRMGESVRGQAACIADGDAAPDVIEKINGLDGRTIHSLLGGFPPNWRYDADNKLPCRLVIVDESSMVDVMLMKALLDALPDDCRLVLLGDGNQLPSVSAGAVLKDMVSNIHDSVRLVKAQRFSGALAKCAEIVNDESFVTDAERYAAACGAWSDVKSLAAHEIASVGGGCRCLRFRVPDDAGPALHRDKVAEWANGFGLLDGGDVVDFASRIKSDDPALTDGTMTEAAKAIFDALGRGRILCVVRKGPYGVEGVNELVARKRNNGRIPDNPFGKVGVPLIVTENCRERNLWSGDIGVTVPSASGIVAIFPRGDKVVSCPVGLLPRHELAYAITVHKSQGSEYDNVLVVLPPNTANPLLTRPLLYTGMTRARKVAVIYGTDASVQKALATSIERATGIFTA